MRDEQHDHDLGLAHDLPRLLGRRRVLAILGGLGAAAIVGCGDDEGATAGTSTTGAAPSSTGATATTAASTGTSAATDCSQIPEETAGPFPGDGSNGPNVLADSGVVRRDITSSFGSSSTVAEGVPLTIDLVAFDTTSGCQALRGAAVYVWHCDREGRYSMYSEGVEGENYLRGVQETDASGRVRFESTFPGAYSGRWPHIHFEVYESLDAATSGGNPIATSQIALPADVCDGAYAIAGYEQSIRNMEQTSLASDMVFADDGGASQLGSASGSPEAGYAVELSVPVDPTAVSTGRSAGGRP